MAQSTTLAATAGVSTAIILNPIAKTTTVLLSNSLVGSTGAVTIELTLDDPTIVGGPTTTWGTLSSGVGMTSSNAPFVYTILSPIGGVRINSTANTTTNTFTLKALQSITN